MMNLDELFKLFVSEKRILQGLNNGTLKGYDLAYRRYKKALEQAGITDIIPDESKLKQYVIRMRESGLTPVTCNISIRGFNSFLSWLAENHHLPTRLRIKQIKEEKRTVQAYSDDELKRILSFKAKDFIDWRVYAIISLLIDCGLRIQEAITLKRNKVDFDNLLITIKGKGSKERIVPFSPELKRTLYRYNRLNTYSEIWFFPTRSGNRMTYQNFAKEWRALCKAVEIPYRSFHKLRHNFGINFIREGGDISELRRLLGHSSITTTQIYINLQTEDLRRAHAKTSILSRLK